MPLHSKGLGAAYHAGRISTASRSIYEIILSIIDRITHPGKTTPSLERVKFITGMIRCQLTM